MTIDHDTIAARVRHSRDTGGPYAWQPDLSAAYLDLYDDRARIAAEWAEASQRNYQRAKSAEAERDALREAADALAFVNARLLQRVRETSADKWMPHAADAADAALATYRTTKEAKE